MDPQSPRRKETSRSAGTPSGTAVGLMSRPAGDRELSLQASPAVLKQQLDDPSQPYNGTFLPQSEEPATQPRALRPVFVQYDPTGGSSSVPRWRSCSKSISDRLPEPLRKQMESAIERAVSSEIAEGRLRPDYSNIALMHGFLWSWAGKRLQRPRMDSRRPAIFRRSLPFV